MRRFIYNSKRNKSFLRDQNIDLHGVWQGQYCWGVQVWREFHHPTIRGERSEAYVMDHVMKSAQGPLVFCMFFEAGCVPRLGWSFPLRRDFTVNTAALFLELIGQRTSFSLFTNNRMNKYICRLFSLLEYNRLLCSELTLSVWGRSGKGSSPGM